MDPRTDHIAREAARLIETGKVESVGEAIHRAIDLLGHHDVPRPGYGRVRKHAQGMAMQALGREEYLQSRLDMLRAVEELMTSLEHAIPDLEPLLVGRAARGEIDGGVVVHLRLYTDSPLAEIARALVDFGCEEPIFETVQTSYGRLNRMRFTDEGLEYVLTRCPENMRISPHTDMFTGKAVTSLTLDNLRHLIESRGELM